MRLLERENQAQPRNRALKAIAEAGEPLEVALQSAWCRALVVSVLCDDAHVNCLGDRRGNACLGVGDPVFDVIQLCDPLGRLPNLGAFLEFVLEALADASAP